MAQNTNWQKEQFMTVGPFLCFFLINFIWELLHCQFSTSKLSINNAESIKGTFFMAFGPFFVSFLELLYDFLSQNCSFPVFCEPCVRYDYAASINRNYNKVYIFKDFVQKHKGSFYFPCKNMCVGSYIPQKITFLWLYIVFTVMLMLYFGCLDAKQKPDSFPAAACCSCR